MAFKNIRVYDPLKHLRGFSCWELYLKRLLGRENPCSSPNKSEVDWGWGGMDSFSYLFLLWIIQGGGWVQHSFLGIVEQLRDVLQVPGRTLVQ